MAPPRRAPMHPQRRPGIRRSPAPGAALLAAAAVAAALAAHLAAAPHADAAFAYEMSPSLPMDKSLPAGGCAESRFVVSERDILAIPPDGMTVVFEVAGDAAEFIELDPPSLVLTDDMPRQFTTLRIEVPEGTPAGSYGGSVTAAKQESATQLIKLKRSFEINVTDGPPPGEGASCVPPTATRAPDPPPAPAGECGPEEALVDGECVGGDQAAGGGCLIATAAYGTELAPQVQRLRELRDLPPLASGPGLDLVSGMSFAYYAFSPAVADLERQSPALREAVRVLIAPAVAAAGAAAPGGDAPAPPLPPLDAAAAAASALLLAAGLYAAAPAGTPNAAAVGRFRGARGRAPGPASASASAAAAHSPARRRWSARTR